VCFTVSLCCTRWLCFKVECMASQCACASLNLELWLELAVARSCQQALYSKLHSMYSLHTGVHNTYMKFAVTTCMIVRSNMHAACCINAACTKQVTADG
jgi:hypothetical protein